MVPPLSTSDATRALESGVFTSWAQLQQRISHPGIFTGTGGGTGVTGFTGDVKLSGPLQRTRDVVFMYTVLRDYAAPKYFRGLDPTLTSGGEGRYPAGPAVHAGIPQHGSP